MARVFIDGFESGGTELWTTEETMTAAAINTSTVNSGKYSVFISDANECLTNLHSFSSIFADTIYFKFYYNCSYWGLYRGAVCSILSTIPDTHASLTIDDTGLFKFTHGNAENTVIGIADTKIKKGEWNLIEGKIVVHSSAGSVILRLNEQEVINETNVRTQSLSTATTIPGFCLGRQYGTSGQYKQAGYYDDIVLDTSTFPGPGKIYALTPNEKGNSEQWSPVGANLNYERINLIPHQWGSRITTNAVDQLDLYELADIFVYDKIITQVKSAQVQAVAAADGSPTPTSINLSLRTNATNYHGSDQTVVGMPPDNSCFFETWTLNPDTSAAWTETEINGMEIGVRSRA